MQEVLLTRNYKCFVDDDLYDIAKHYNWCAQETRANGATNFIAKRKVTLLSMQYIVYLHKLAAGVPKCFKVSFKDGNWLNYQENNLKRTDRKGRPYHFHKFKKDSQYRGVVFDLFYGLWRAEFHKLTIGYYDNEVDAARAYNIKMREIYKNPAKNKLNVITILDRYHENNPRYRRNG